jgi:acetyl-CoA carboxylase biotin carboxyl carrier protein
MAGSIFRILVEVGQSFDVGDEVVVLESMKMEIPVIADGAGTVMAVRVGVGDAVDQDDVLIDYE